MIWPKITTTKHYCEVINIFSVHLHPPPIHPPLGRCAMKRSILWACKWARHNVWVDRSNRDRVTKMMRKWEVSSIGWNLAWKFCSCTHCWVAIVTNCHLKYCHPKCTDSVDREKFLQSYPWTSLSSSQSKRIHMTLNIMKKCAFIHVVPRNKNQDVAGNSHSILIMLCIDILYYL